MKKQILLFLCVASFSTLTVKSQTLVALTSANQLMQITNPANPASTSAPVPITGVVLGQNIIGIDYRPNTGELYALGYNTLLTVLNAQLYVLDVSTGAATSVGAASTLNLGSNGIAFDFNPTVDRIRVMGENGMNYRLHPLTGAIAATDGSLAYAAADVNAGMTPAVAACAYTNSYIGSEGTTLYDYDKTLNILVSQIPPNNGTLNTIGAVGIVSSGGSNIGMDIYFNPATKTNQAYLNAMVGGVNNLYTLNTSTGAATLLGAIGTGTTDIREIAMKIDRTVPATYGGQLVYGLTRVNRNLVSFSTDNPELIRTLMPITGITAGQIIVGMDIRPLDLGLYALGYKDTTNSYQLYNINTTTGAATAIGSPGTIDLGLSQRIGFDFNPTVDRIRVVSTNNKNYRLNPITGAVAATDSSLAFATGDINLGINPYVSSVAYINSFSGTSTTTLFAIDDSLSAFCSIAPPNLGVLNTISSVPAFNLADLSNDIDFFYDSTAAQNIGYLAANMAGSTFDNLYLLSTSGAVTMIDSIGWGLQLSDIAVQLTYTGILTTGISRDKKTQFAIYPNPVSDMLKIEFDVASTNDLQLQIADITGRLIKTEQIRNGVKRIEISASDLAPGLYFVSQSDNAARTIKFIKE